MQLNQPSTGAIQKCPIHNVELTKKCPDCQREWGIPSFYDKKHQKCKTCGIKITLKDLIKNNFILKDERYKLITKIRIYLREGNAYFNKDAELFARDSYTDRFRYYFKYSGLGMTFSDFKEQKILMLSVMHRFRPRISNMDQKVNMIAFSTSSYTLIDTEEDFLDFSWKNSIFEESIYNIKRIFIAEFKKYDKLFIDCSCESNSDFTCIRCFICTRLV